MKAEEIKDRETLEAWLRGRPRRDSIVIAHRAALRVLPVWGAAMGEDWARKRDWTVLPLLRCALVSHLASHATNVDFAGFAVAADDSAADIWASALNIGRNSPGSGASAAADAIQSGYQAVQLVGGASIETVARVIRTAEQLDESRSILSATKLDARSLEEGKKLSTCPLWYWPDHSPKPFRSMERDMLAIWDGDPPDRWDFWRRWWEGAKTGQPLDPELQLAIVKGVDEETWKDPDKVAARIAEIEDAFNTERAAEDRLDEVIAATPNAERVEGNLDSGALILVPDSGIDGALFDYAARKVAGAISIIRLDGSNQYTALEADLAMLQAALEVTPGLPLELFDACASATGRLVLRCEIGDLPPLEKDPVLTDYRSRLRDAGADLYGNDPQTQSVVAARNALAGNDVFLEHPRDVGAAVEEIGPALEGHLATALPRDAKIASDPAASAEERKPATYRLVSRTLRIAKIAGYVVGGGAATIVGTKEVLEAIPVIQASPHFQKLVELALRWLGF
ncbi:hypothetical protein [Mameliella alba]|nr:hypothetical protein [Mameliella alba]